jgi:hypothetical protein
VRTLVLLSLGCADVPGSVGALEDACASCHPAQAEAFAEGGMAYAATSDVFVALRERAAAEDPVTAALCDGCHTPAVGRSNGLTCGSCHAAVGHNGVENGLLIWDLDGPVRGPTGVVDASSPHAAVAGGLFGDSELCGTCHEVRGPAGFEESPFAHWRDSPAAAAGVGCVDCHMSATPGVDRATVDGSSTDHRFVGLNGDPEAAVALLRAAVGVRLSRDGRVARIEVTNHGRGHDLPDGASFLRELWVDVSGPDGPLVAPAWLSTRLLRGGVEVADPLVADQQVRGALPPGGSLVIEVDTAGPVTACVKFRAERQDLRAELGLHATGEVWDVVCVDDDQPEVRPP